MSETHSADFELPAGSIPVAPTTPGQQLASAPNPDCQRCNGTGSCDSGGVTPWGASIDIRCDCTYP